MSQTFFRIRTPDVTSEEFKDEVLIIDLKTGNYHSLRGSAAQIWRCLGANPSLEECVEALQGSYGNEVTTIFDDTNIFLVELEAIGLISTSTSRDAAGEIALEKEPGAYESPVVHSYGDLQDLLLLDPIHEIAPESGWPHRLKDS
jgi:hypothetical protein